MVMLFKEIINFIPFSWVVLKNSDWIESNQKILIPISSSFHNKGFVAKSIEIEIYN